uniref:Uncharacterized protein n=1 Tax=Physcomitrium patens TaxID=3218 RepID=A0A2K1KT68_PHYPA|nr:hypothetical protein PHYPA_003939 [Physcomitrium patens]
MVSVHSLCHKNPKFMTSTILKTNWCVGMTQRQQRFKRHHCIHLPHTRESAQHVEVVPTTSHHDRNQDSFSKIRLMFS